MDRKKTAALSGMHTKVLVLLSAGHLVTDLAAGALPILLPLIQASLGLSYSAAGLISLVFNVSSSVLQPILGFWSDKVKSRWLLPAGCFLSMIGLALTGTASTYWFVLAVVFTSGLGAAAYHPEASKVSRLASGHRRATGMSLFIVGGALGAALGTIIMGKLLTIFDKSASIYFFLPGVIMAVLFLVYYRMLPDDPAPAVQKIKGDSKTAPKKILFPLIVLILVIIVRSWIQAGLTHFMPLYLVNYLGRSPNYVSSLLVSFMLAGAVGTILGGPVADRFGRKNMLVVSTAVLIPLLFLLKYSTGIWSMIVLFVTGMVIVSTMPTTVVMGQEMLPHRIGVASGLMTGFATGMGGVGVSILGAIADNFGAPTAFMTLTLLPLAAFVLSLLLPRDDVKEY
ncbi:MAG: MFS transporter [Desulfotomaculum sp.]|nr:MFS transporter [Desulfotomaculum sp.]